MNFAEKVFAREYSRLQHALGGKRYVDEHPEMKKALYVVPKHDTVIGKAANFVLHVAERMEKEGVSRATQAAVA